MYIPCSVEIPQALAKLAGYHSSTSRECTEVEYASPEWEWAMVEETGTPSTRMRAHEELEAETDALGSDESEGKITDLPFKNVGQFTRFLDKRRLQIQRTMDSIEKAYPCNSVSQEQNAGLSYLTPTHSTGTASRVADKQDKPDKPARSRNSRRRNLRQEALDSTDNDDILADASIPPLDPKRLMTSKVCQASRDL
jgi:hypothetical protein